LFDESEVGSIGSLGNPRDENSCQPSSILFVAMARGRHHCGYPYDLYVYFVSDRTVLLIVVILLKNRRWADYLGTALVRSRLVLALLL
jgi:hypothetical protein